MAKRGPKPVDRELRDQQEYFRRIASECFLEDRIIPPREETKNHIFRTFILNECEHDSENAARIRSYFARDILFAFNTFFWLHDTRSEAGLEEFPFITWPYQDQTILDVNEAIQKGEDVFIDKSRDMGATYIVLLVYLWRWLTKRSEHFRIGSDVEDKIDKAGDMGTHFEKLRFNLRRIPWFILPFGFNIDKHCTYMRIFNPEKYSTIVGESTKKNFSAGTRPKSILFDEFARWEWDYEAWRSASDATPCKIPLGTPLGMANKFAELARTDDIKKKIHLMWYLHPKKAVTSKEHLKKVRKGLVRDKIEGYTVTVEDPEPKKYPGCYIDARGKVRSEWYDNETDKRDKEDIQENLDCNYLTSGRPVFDTVLCDAKMRACELPKWTGNLIWKVRPIFDDAGDCINQNGLEDDFRESGNGIYKIWEMPVKGWVNGYVLAADSAEGLAQGDFNSATVIRRFDCKHPYAVATLHCKLKDFEYAEELVKLAIFYGRCLLAPERNDIGKSVIRQALKYYDNIFMKQVFTKGFPESTDKYGWETNKGNKPIIISGLNQAITDGVYDDPDEGFWRECLTFMNNDGKLEAQGKSRGQRICDDRVMDRAIGYYVCQDMDLPYKERSFDGQRDYEERLIRKHQARQGKSLVGWVIRPPGRNV